MASSCVIMSMSNNIGNCFASLHHHHHHHREQHHHNLEKTISADIRVQSATNPRSCNRKSVTFATTEDVIVHVLHISDYTPEEIASSWYTRQEMKAIKTEGKLLLGRVLGGYVPTDKDGTVRGMEGFTRDRMLEKKQNKYIGREAVLQEQRLQREAGIQDPDFLADVYFDATEHCQVAAQMMAVRDAFDAAHEQERTEQQVRTACVRKNAVIMGISAAVAQSPPDASCHFQVLSTAA